MIIIGLTGGIGSGKTTVGKLFKKLGIPVYNSDKQAKKLMKKSKTIRNEVKKLLGDEAYVDNKPDKVYVASKVFNNKDLLQQLNAIIHPAVRKHFKKWAKKKQSPYVIQETAILFENSMQAFYDKVILVTAPEEVRIARIKERGSATDAQIKARMKNQWEDERKIPLADFIIENIDLDQTVKNVKEVHGILLDHSGH